MISLQEIFLGFLIALAAMTNTLVKTMLAAWLGGWDLARHVAPGMLFILMVGGLVVVVLG